MHSGSVFVYDWALQLLLHDMYTCAYVLHFVITMCGSYSPGAGFIK